MIIWKNYALSYSMLYYWIAINFKTTHQWMMDSCRYRVNCYNCSLKSLTEELLTNKYCYNQIHLQYNKLTYIQRDIFLGLSNLEILDLSNNMIQTIENSAFSDLPKLRTLYLNNNELTNISMNVFGKNVRNLRELYLQRNKLVSIIQNHTYVFEHLNVLDLSSNIFKTFNGTLAKFLNNTLYPRLERLNLGNNYIEAVSAFCGFSNYVMTIDLAYNNLISYENCDIGSQNNTSKAKIKPTWFHHANLSHNLLKSISFNYLRNVVVLNASYNNISYIDVKETSGVDGDFNIEILDLGHNLIRRLPLKSFGKLFDLKQLNLTYNQISVVELGAFGTLYSLWSIDLSYNDLKSVEELPFHALSNLQFARFDNNRISSVDKNFIKYHKRLKKIYLHRNNFTCDSLIELLRLLRENDVKLDYFAEPEGHSIEGVDCEFKDGDYTSVHDLQTESSYTKSNILQLTDTNNTELHSQIREVLKTITNERKHFQIILLEVLLVGVASVLLSFYVYKKILRHRKHCRTKRCKISNNSVTTVNNAFSDNEIIYEEK